MKRIFPLAILLIGILISTYSLWNIAITKKQADTSLVEAKQLIEKQDPMLEKETSGVKVGDVMGILMLPTIKKELAIVEGTDPDDLEKGVGHYAGSYFPGENGQIVLSGHRDTVFSRLGELKIGEEIKVQMPYGDFSYEIIRTKIVDADDRSIITLQNKEEELIVTTCYPFGYIGNAPNRYIIYAKRKNDE